MIKEIHKTQVLEEYMETKHASDHRRDMKIGIFVRNTIVYFTFVGYQCAGVHGTGE